MTVGTIYRWRCSDKSCPAREPQEAETGKLADKAAGKHTEKEGHATLCWAEPPLPIAVEG